MSYRYAYFGTGKNKDIEVKPKADHLCESCQAPIYDKKPVCVICFKNGAFPEKMWKRNKPQVVKNTKRKNRKAKLTSEQKWNKRVEYLKKKKERVLTDNQLLSKLGAFAYHQLKRKQTKKESTYLLEEGGQRTRQTESLTK